MASIKKTKGVFIPPVVTPGRSPRLAARNLLEQETTKQVTPVKETLKKFLLTRGESKVLLDELQSFIKCSEKYRLLEATSITAEIEFNVIKTNLVITRSIKTSKHFSNDSLQVKLLVRFSTKLFRDSLNCN